MEDTTPIASPVSRLTVEEIKHICRGMAGNDRMSEMLCLSDEELRQGFEIIKRHPHMVTVLGSARTPETDFYYEKARELGMAVVRELGLPVATGGGPGIMEAANRGAKEAGGISLGMTIVLPMEQSTNPYTTESVDFNFFFTRKVIMTYGARMFVYFPGGFGTLNEFFEILTLVQTKKIPPVPIVLFGSEYWQPLQDFIRDHVRAAGLIDEGDMSTLYTITDSIDDIVTALADFSGEKKVLEHV